MTMTLRRCEICNIPRDNIHESLCPICIQNGRIQKMNKTLIEIGIVKPEETNDES